MDITITDVYSAQELLLKSPGKYRLVSIASPNHLLNNGAPTQLEGAAEVLYLQFDDLTPNLVKFAKAESNFRLADAEDCRKALEFLQKGGCCLVHCAAGISRSTATVLGYLLTCHDDYRQAVDKLIEIRNCARPNDHIVKLMCDILHRNHEYEKIMEYCWEARNKHIKQGLKNGKPPEKIKTYFDRNTSK